MKKTLAGAVCAYCAFVSHSQAAELTGGSIDLGYSAFTDDSDFSRVALRGQAEIGFSRSIAMQVDLGAYDFDTFNDTGYNFALHGIYHVNDAVSLGGFYSRDDIADGDGDIFGLEAGFDLSTNVAAEAYASTGDSEGVDLDLFGFDIAYGVTDAFEVNAGIDYAEVEGGADLTRYSLGVEFQTETAGNYYAELGSLDASFGGLSGSEAYIGVGVRIDFGAERGATFGQRSFLDIIPGL